MNKLELKLLEIVPQEGYVVLNFQASSLDPALYASGNIGVTHPNGEGFEQDKVYDLDLVAIE